MKKIKFTKTNLSGNATAFIWDKIPRQNQPKIAGQIMKNNCLAVEQVGFVEKPTLPNSVAKLQMMGGEICINATLSLVDVLSKKLNQNKFNLELSGYNEIIPCKITGTKTTITTTPNSKISKVSLNISGKPKKIFLVNLSGIAYFLVNKKLIPKKPNYILEFNKIKSQVRNVKLPSAWGVIFYSKNKIQPVVYVKKTNSVVAENACGSGSLALNLIYNYKKIIQPTNEAIVFNKINNKISISGKSKIISEGYVYIY